VPVYFCKKAIKYLYYNITIIINNVLLFSVLQITATLLYRRVMHDIHTHVFCDAVRSSI